MAKTVPHTTSCGLLLAIGIIVAIVGFYCLGQWLAIDV